MKTAAFSYTFSRIIGLGRFVNKIAVRPENKLANRPGKTTKTWAIPGRPFPGRGKCTRVTPPFGEGPDRGFRTGQAREQSERVDHDGAGPGGATGLAGAAAVAPGRVDLHLHHVGDRRKLGVDGLQRAAISTDKALPGFAQHAAAHIHPGQANPHFRLFGRQEGPKCSGRTSLRAPDAVFPAVILVQTNHGRQKTGQAMPGVLGEEDSAWAEPDAVAAPNAQTGKDLFIGGSWGPKRPGQV